MSQDNGGPAFPRSYTSGCSSQTGMTLRDYFAAKAMQTLLAAAIKQGVEQIAHVPATSYKVADAMLKAREAT